MQRNHLRPVENKAIHKENVYVVLRMDIIDDTVGDSYWSKTSGWVPLYGATRFLEEDKIKFTRLREVGIASNRREYRDWETGGRLPRQGS